MTLLPGDARATRGRVVQLDPIKPKSKLPGTERLKLKHDELLPILPEFCFQIPLAPLHRGMAPVAAVLRAAVQARNSGGGQIVAAQTCGHAAPLPDRAGGRGLHAFTIQLNLLRF